MERVTVAHHLAVALALATFAVWVPSESALAHCDTVDGPVVASARRALAQGKVTHVLKWVGPEHEEEVKALFADCLAVRQLGDGPRQFADRYFFETVVRLHREGEGFGYTGLKPAGTQVPPAVLAADAALEAGSVDDLIAEIAEAISAGIRNRFEHAHETRAHAEQDVAAGREFVAAYVEFTHYVEALEALAAGHPAGHATGAAHRHGASE